MPTPYIQKLAQEGKGSVESLEKKWDEAKAKAGEEGKGDNYGYITSIFKSSLGIKGALRIEASARLRASDEIVDT